MHLNNVADDGLGEDNQASSNVIPLRSPSPASHCHVPNDNEFDYNARNRLIGVLILCVIFMSIEVVGGIISNSTAVLTDAVHMGIDVTSFLMSLAAIHLATKRPTERLSYGYIRAEVLGALMSILFLWLSTGILVYVAILRCIYQQFKVNPIQMIVIASFGVLFNIIMLTGLHINVGNQSMPHHGHSHGGKGYESLEEGRHNHSHDRNYVHSHGEGQFQQTVPQQSKSTTNINIRAAVIHVVGDFVQSMGVLLAALVILINPEYKLADPICTLIFSILVMITTFTIMRDIVHVLMEGVPSNVSYTRVVDDLLALPGVRNAHSLHIWSLSTEKAALSVHLAIDQNRDSLVLLGEAQEMLRREHSITCSTIQIEVYDEDIMKSCERCQRPGS